MLDTKKLFLKRKLPFARSNGFATGSNIRQPSQSTSAEQMQFICYSFSIQKYYPFMKRADENNAAEAKRHNIKHNELFTYK